MFVFFILDYSGVAWHYLLSKTIYWTFHKLCFNSSFLRKKNNFSTKYLWDFLDQVCLLSKPQQREDIRQFDAGQLGKKGSYEIYLRASAKSKTQTTCQRFGNPKQMHPHAELLFPPLAMLIVAECISTLTKTTCGCSSGHRLTHTHTQGFMVVSRSPAPGRVTRTGGVSHSPHGRDLAFHALSHGPSHTNASELGTAWRKHATLDAKSETGRSTRHQRALGVLFPNHPRPLPERC